MKRALLVIGSSILLSSLASLAYAQQPPSPGPRPLPSVPIKPIYITCIDPAASAIDYSLVNKATPSTGTVRIKATVKNVGNAAYVSRPDQQEALLYEVRPGSNNPTVIARSRFQNLDPGEAVSFTVDRPWTTAQEFPSTFRLVIVYDPDIRSDGNPKNDDCRMTNNSLDRGGADINGLFR
jgi:hypothetical protein